MADSIEGESVPGRPDELVAAIERMFGPLVRLLLEKQLTFPFLSGVLKRVYVEVALRDLTLGNRKQTDSRISLLTGVHRKDVKRLRSGTGSGAGRSAIGSRGAALGALLVSRWTADPKFLDESGKPRPLPRQPGAKGVESFESLVTSVSKDIPPRSVLDEWVRLGTAEIDDLDVVRLREESFVPEHGLDEKLHFFGRNLRDHIASGVHNILEDGPPFFDRSVFYDELSPESVDELRDFASVEAADLLRRVNQRALELQTRDRSATDRSRRMTVGAYFFSAYDAESDEDAR